LGEMMGQSLARRIIASDALAHVLGEFGDLLIAEAVTVGTPLVGKTLHQSKLRESVGVSVVGIWERGRFEVPTPNARISAETILVLAGSREQLEKYNELFCIYHVSDAPVLILGGGRVARAIGKELIKREIDYRIVEKLPERVRDPKKYVVGEASDIEVLKKAGIMEAPTVIITPHDDDTNLYLAIYCRKLRPDIQIICRATLESNISTMHRAGADFVMSYASMGANAIFNLLQRSDVLMVAEGLNVFEVDVPTSLSGKTIADSSIREETGCSVVAFKENGTLHINPHPKEMLPTEGKIILIGSVIAENQFFKRYK